MSKIGRAGPQHAAILNTDSGLIESNESSVLVIDENLISKLKFIKEGEFVEKEGATALKLVGDLVPVDQVEVVRHVKENLTKTYPLSANELADAVKKALPTTRQHHVWDCIKENGIKDDAKYSAYNFRSKRHEDLYKASGVIPNGTPSIYNHAAVDYIVNVLKGADGNA